MSRTLLFWQPTFRVFEEDGQRIYEALTEQPTRVDGRRRWGKSWRPIPNTDVGPSIIAWLDKQIEREQEERM